MLDHQNYFNEAVIVSFGVSPHIQIISNDIDLKHVLALACIHCKPLFFSHVKSISAHFAAESRDRMRSS